MDKLAKVRAEVKKLNAQLLRGACSSQVAMETRCKEEAYNEVLAILDTTQEEPVSIWHDAREKSNKPESVVIINPNDYSGDVIPNCIGVNEGNLWACTSDLLNIENPCKFGKNLQEESVSEKLIDVAKQYVKEHVIGIDKVTFSIATDMFISGAKWKEQQMMAKAIDAELCSDGMFTPLISVNDKEKISDIKFGDKVKVILIKK